MKIDTKEDMISCMQNSTNPDDQGNITLSDDVLQILNIIIIFLKVKDKLG